MKRSEAEMLIGLVNTLLSAVARNKAEGGPLAKVEVSDNFLECLRDTEYALKRKGRVVRVVAYDVRGIYHRAREMVLRLPYDNGRLDGIKLAWNEKLWSSFLKDRDGIAARNKAWVEKREAELEASKAR